MTFQMTVRLGPANYGREDVLGFATSAEAWAAMHLLDEQGHMCGYPSLKPEANGLYSLQVRYKID